MKNKIILTTILGAIFTTMAISFVLAEDNEEEQGDNYQIINNTPTATSNPINLVAAAKVGLVDSDSDGVIDALDKHPGEDDFAFGISDDNRNGVVDSFEYLQVRIDY